MTSPLRFGWCLVLVVVAAVGAPPAFAQADYRVLATSRTSTMQREMLEASEAGYRFVAAMGGETSFGGSEVVVVMGRSPESSAAYEYRLLATSKTSTMQKELQEASDAGFEYRGQTVFKTAFGGQEVVVILERRRDESRPLQYEYRLLATSKTSTMQKEILETAAQGFEVVGLTVGETLLGGSELVTIMRRARQ